MPFLVVGNKDGKNLSAFCMTKDSCVLGDAGDENEGRRRRQVVPFLRFIGKFMLTTT